MSIWLTCRQRNPRRLCQLGVRYPKLAILLFVVFMYLQVKASSLDLQMPTRGRVAPKLACVQDIRPHVPELGCTSAVQNEKYIFHFCTAECNPATLLNKQHQANRVRYPKLAILFVVFMYLQVKASSLDLQMPRRGRVAPKLACVQDIRPHVPELGCTSAVQNEKYIFHFVLLSVRPFVGTCLNALTGRGATSPVMPTWGSIPQVGNTIRGIHVFASQGIEP